MIRFVLFDIDGVIIRHKDDYINNIDPIQSGYYQKVLSEFHNGKINEDCDRGISDPLVEIEPFLEKIGWEGNSKSYFDKRFEFESQYIDFKLLNEIRELKNMGLKIFIASNQNRYRRSYLIERLKAIEIFNKAYFSCDFGYIKPEKKYFESIIIDLKSNYGLENPKEVMFFDDVSANCKAAKKCKINAVQIKRENDIYIEIEKIRSITIAST